MDISLLAGKRFKIMNIQTSTGLVFNDLPEKIPMVIKRDTDPLCGYDYSIGWESDDEERYFVLLVKQV